jgi:hypothetical protein
MTELEYQLEIARIRAEAKATILKVRDLAKAVIDKLSAAVEMATAEQKILLQVVYSSGDARTIKDVNAFLKAMHGRLEQFTGQSQATSLH